MCHGGAICGIVNVQNGSGMMAEFDRSKIGKKCRFLQNKYCQDHDGEADISSPGKPTKRTTHIQI